ncbi:MAG: hypothetical protein EOO44_15190 [Flavobacterium sp.]|nr:MAG: hypothetical protein EOO44_15190 [Flavobacterium sp.]
MRKLLLIPLLFCSMAFSQEFILTANNYVNNTDESKNYIVVEYPDLSQKELFDKTKTFIHTKFQNLKGDGLNEVQFSHLKLRSKSPGAYIKMFGSKNLTDYINITYDISFKDGKVMIKAIFEDFEANDIAGEKTYLTGGNSWSGKSIFNKNGKIWLKEYFDDANNKANQFLQELKAYLSNKEDW